MIARGQQHGDVFPMFGVDDWQQRMESVERAYGGFRAEDLYPDALRSIGGLRDLGYRVAIVANQPAARAEQLRAIGVDAEVLAMSESLGVAKPDPAFFGRILELLGTPEPGSVAYVGDRVDNDVLPAVAAGMRGDLDPARAMGRHRGLATAGCSRPGGGVARRARRAHRRGLARLAVPPRIEDRGHLAIADAEAAQCMANQLVADLPIAPRRRAGPRGCAVPPPRPPNGHGRRPRSAGCGSARR